MNNPADPPDAWGTSMDGFTPIVETPATPHPADAPRPTEGASSTLRRSESDQEVVDLDELTYRSVPFKVVGRRQVVYRYAGPLRPMRYEYDEDLE